MTRVDETAQGKAIRAGVVLDKKGHLVAKIQARYGSGGGVLVNVFQYNGNAKEGEKGYYGPDKQAARAGGYGYDKFTACISGMTIAGVKITDHCGERLKLPRKGFFTQDSKLPKGYRLANYTVFDHATKKGANLPRGWTHGHLEYETRMKDGRLAVGYAGAYRDPGLDILPAYGFRVIWAI